MQPAEDLLKPYHPWLRWLIWLLLAVATMFALRQLLPIVAWILDVLKPFLIALILAYLFNPIVNFVQVKLKLGRVTGILIVILILLGIFVGLVIWLVPVLYHQIGAMLRGIREALPKFIDRVLTNHFDPETIAGWRAQVEAFFADFEANSQQSLSQVGGALAPVGKGAMAAVSTIASRIAGFLGGVGGLAATLTLSLVAAFYFLADMDDIPRVIRALLPDNHRERIWTLMLKADRSVGGFLRGQLLDCVCIAILTTVVLMIVGLGKYAVLIGCFAGLMNFVPYLGPIAGATPAVLWALATDSMDGWHDRGYAIMLIIGGFAIVQAIDGMVFQPLIVGKQASLHPLAVMVALAVGAQAGIGGMIVAVPVACILRVLWIELVWKDRVELEAESFRPRKRKTAQPTKEQETP